MAADSKGMRGAMPGARAEAEQRPAVERAPASSRSCRPGWWGRYGLAVALLLLVMPCALLVSHQAVRLLGDEASQAKDHGSLSASLQDRFNNAVIVDGWLQVPADLSELGLLALLVWVLRQDAPARAVAPSDAPRERGRFLASGGSRLFLVAGALALACLGLRVSDHWTLSIFGWAGVVILLGGAWLRQLAQRGHVLLAGALGAGFLLRLALAMGLNAVGMATNLRGVVLDDESASDYAARVILQVIPPHETTLAPSLLPVSLIHLSGPYTSLLTAAYELLGPAALAGRLLNVVLGMALVALAAVLARRIAGPSAAMGAAALVALLPAEILWSSMLLKEAFVSLLTLLAFWYAWRLAERRRWEAALGLVLVLHVVGTVRLAVALGVLISLVLVLALVERQKLVVVWRERRPLVALGAIALVAAVTVTGMFVLDGRKLVERQVALNLTPPPFARLGPDTTGIGLVGAQVGGPIMAVENGEGTGHQIPGMLIAQKTQDGLTTDYVATMSGGLLVAPSTQVLMVRAMDEGDAWRYLGQGLAGGLREAFLAPLDLGIDRPTYGFFALDDLLWLALLGLAVAAELRRRDRLREALLAFVALMVLALSVAEGNTGNLSRERGSLTEAPLAVVGAGLLASVLLRRPEEEQEKAPAL